MKKFTVFLVVGYLLFSSSCKKEDQSVIEPDFREYVDRFVSEAGSRNVNINTGKLNVRYSDTLKYYHGYGMPNDVVIRPSVWENASDAQKEILLFHELGHALLMRTHDNSKLPNGDFQTIMTTGNFYYCYSDFTPEKRKYYLDKLFIESTPQPEWSVERTAAKLIFRDTINAATPWYYYKNSYSPSVGSLSSSAYVTPGTSLSIKSEIASGNISHWSHSFRPYGIKQSTRLVLSVKVKLENVTGNGIYIVLRGDVKTKVAFFTTTQGVKKISGTSDFAEYSVEVPYYIAETDYIIIFLIFGDQTTGTAYFDDITLTNLE